MLNLPVTRPYMPPLEDVVKHLQRAWDARWLTNDGALVREMEARFAELLEAPHVFAVNNGTIALMVALKALNLPNGAEVITTPFTFVATTQAIAWCGLKVVFVDVDPQSGTLDPACVEKAITPRTAAIVDVHVYGMPAKANELQALAKANGLKVMYDASHALTTRINGQPISAMGDVSVFSLHATKLIHSGEGGLIVTHDPVIADAVRRVRSYGMTGPETIVELGLNGKMSEVNAAVGLACLPHVMNVRTLRQQAWNVYEEGLQGLAGLELLHPSSEVEHAYFYAPVRIRASLAGMDRDSVRDYLAGKGIAARRYFYPLTCEFPPFRDVPSANLEGLPQAYALSREVLCLPLYADITREEVLSVCACIREALHLN
jgi:dTDP-4-amino-4,6-dideoxygalactose transaminase